jgi:ribosomal-protein-alanine N-acetyltransferase
MRTLRTQRLHLVPVTAANAELLWRVLQEPDLRDFQDLPDLYLPQFRRTVGERPRTFAPGVVGRFEWLVFLDGEPDAVGWVSLRIGDRTPTTAEIGYSVVRQQRSRGIASEAVAALIAEGFERLQLRRMRAYCVPENLSSRAVLRRNLFEDDGMLAHGATVQGHPVDVIAHTLERDRWESSVTQNRSAIGS